MLSVRDLKPGGRDIPVTDENKEEYVKLVCQMKMTGQFTHFLFRQFESERKIISFESLLKHNLKLKSNEDANILKLLFSIL